MVPLGLFVPEDHAEPGAGSEATRELHPWFALVQPIQFLVTVSFSACQARNIGIMVTAFKKARSPLLKMAVPTY